MTIAPAILTHYIPGRRLWEKPTSYLIKDAETATGWREESSGRRPSELLLVPRIRAAVDAWREGGYPVASVVTQRLFSYWFEEDHEVPGFGVPFRYYFCQREAIETLAWLVELAGQRDALKLIQAYGTNFVQDRFATNISFQTTMEGRRQLHRYVPELKTERLQDLPPEDLRRFAFKMATGTGKTWVMAMAIVWSRFHKQRVAGSELSTNFLIVAPNVIVYQRLERDFAANRIFYELPLIPPEWRGSFSQKVIDRAKLPSRFATLYPAVRDYVAMRCFGKAIDLEQEALRSHLARLEMQEGIANYLARKIAELTIERRAIEMADD